MRQILSISIILLLAASCKKKDTTINYGYHYFSYDEGQYVVYDVIDIFHDVALIPAHDTDTYQIKEVVGESFTDEEGDEARKLRRYYRDNDSLPWAVKDVWAIKRTAVNAEVVEENDRYVKMAFAISYDKDWDCNALNNESGVTCYYERIYMPFTAGGFTHDSTVTVEHENFKSFIDYRRSYEVFASNVGRIYSVRKNLTIDNNDTLDVQYGTELFYSAVEWGK